VERVHVHPVGHRAGHAEHPRVHRREVDGRVGDVDRVNLDAGSSYLLVATGPPLLGKKLLVPAGLVDAIDRDKEIVHVGCSEDDLKSAPAYDKDREGDPVYREQVGAYYAAAGSPEDRGTD
jgi:hypothetical protein